ncbi:MAG TPA: biopolymer transporter ExbD [Opitutaceae bacterium]|jgi:biopolymer transport protein ExbD
MARTFRRQRQSHPIAEMNVTNLVDLGFTLLIIFMIATSYSKQEQTIPLKLPQESQSTQVKPAANQHFIALSIDASGQFYVENDQVDLAELRQRLAHFAAESQKPVMRIRGDAQVPYQKVIQLMDELKKAGLSEITFDTQTEGK